MAQSSMVMMSSPYVSLMTWKSLWRAVWLLAPTVIAETIEVLRGFLGNGRTVWTGKLLGIRLILACPLFPRRVVLPIFTPVFHSGSVPNEMGVTLYSVSKTHDAGDLCSSVYLGLMNTAKVCGSPP